MKTRRNFIKGLLGVVSVVLAPAGAKAASGKIKKAKYTKDYEAGVQAAIQAGKTGPFLGWTCFVDVNQNQPPLHCKITTINHKNKTITVQTDSLLKYLKAGGKMKSQEAKKIK